MVATSKGRWVDGPYKLLESPASTRDIVCPTRYDDFMTLTYGQNRHYAIAMSNEMSCVHNCFIRAFNSILLQGPDVPSHGQPLYKAKDVKDLCTFMDCTIMSLNHHHDSEEKVLFPALEREIGMMGYLDVASEQHKEFHDGLFALWNYVKAGMSKPEDWRWDEMQKLFEVFMPALLVHLAEEVDLLLTLERFEEAGLRKAWDESIDEAKKVGLAGMVSCRRHSGFSVDAKMNCSIPYSR